MWDAYLFHFTSGQLGPRLRPESASWSISLNDIETMRVNLQKSDLPNVNLHQAFDHWYNGIVLTYFGVPIVAGVIVAQPYQSTKEIHLQCEGVRSVLVKRLVIQEQQDWNALAKQTVTFKNLSLGTIAKKVVELAQMKPGGGLPIDFPISDEVSIHERNYQSFNLSNISADDVLTKLSNVIDGPDIMFRPKFVDVGGTIQLRWDMVYGSKNYPRITQRTAPEWDASAVNSNIVDMSMISSGAYMTHRVFALGAGEDKAKIIRMAQNLDKTRQGYPFLESVYANSNSETPSVVLEHAQGSLAQNYDKLQEITITVRADGDPHILGSYFVGDQITIHTKGWIGFNDGGHKARLLAITGDMSNEVKLSVQLEE